MDNLLNSVEEVLIDSLSFKVPGSGEYMTDRRSVTFHQEGSNVYSPQAGTTLIRLKIAADQWADPSTIRVMFDVVNDDNSGTKRLRPVGRPHAFFRRLRIGVRGTIIEDVDSFNRVTEMFRILQSPHARYNDSVEGF